jgi:hypothetical protein
MLDATFMANETGGGCGPVTVRVGCGLDRSGKPSELFHLSTVVCFMYCLNYIAI